jgi:hypothetical protein
VKVRLYEMMMCEMASMIFKIQAAKPRKFTQPVKVRLYEIMMCDDHNDGQCNIQVETKDDVALLLGRD